MKRLQVLAAAIVVVLAVGAAAFADREIRPRPLASGDEGERAPSGAWYCPHGGGEEWDVALQIANPGDVPASVRVRALGAARPSATTARTIAPGSVAIVPVDAGARERTSMVEWFGQWVAVGWVSHAGGDEGGLAAEPCASASGRRWLLPDGSTATEDQNDTVVVMNPSARDAVVSFTLLSERREPVRKSELTDIVLKPFHSMVVSLNEKVLGEETVATIVEAAAGRVVAATLGISTSGGIRSTLGYLGDPPDELVFPGGEDAGRTQLAVMSTGLERVDLSSDLLRPQPGSEQPFAGIADAAPPAESARTFTATTEGPTTVVFGAAAPGVAAVRRTFGVASDQAATAGGVPRSAWIVLPAVGGSPSHPGLALANPGHVPAEVVLSRLGSDQATVTTTIPPRTSVLAPDGFVAGEPDAAVVAVATQGTFVPSAASYSRGREGFAAFAVALGIPVPTSWVPR